MLSSNIVFKNCLSPIMQLWCCSRSNCAVSVSLSQLLTWKKNLLDKIKTVLSNIFEQSDSFINSFLLFGDISADDSSNAIILNTTMKYMASTRRSSIFTVLYLRFQRNNKYFIEINLKSIFNTNFLYFLVHYFKLAF